uniref:Uncharacterized protein n=1 Tax=Strigamia maritima TaxID=126957 RepID=T1JDE8_STRMM
MTSICDSNFADVCCVILFLGISLVNLIFEMMNFDDEIFLSPLTDDRNLYTALQRGWIL